MRFLARQYFDRRATAGIEFALVLPVAVIILLAFYDLTLVIISKWQVITAADAIARIATTMAATSSGTNTLSDTQVQKASTAIFGAMPFLAKLPPSRYGVAISSVVMSPTQPGCTSNCTYSANVAWSMAPQGTASKRPCGTLNNMPDGQSPSSIALPIDAFTSAPVLVVDVSYSYVPLITTLLGAGLRLSEAVYIGTRTGNDSAWIHLTGTGAAAAQCPGYTG